MEPHRAQSARRQSPHTRRNFYRTTTGRRAPIEPNPQQEGNPPTEDGSSSDPSLGDGLPQIPIHSKRVPQQNHQRSSPLILHKTTSWGRCSPQEQDNVGPLDPIKENITPLAAETPFLSMTKHQKTLLPKMPMEKALLQSGSEEFVPYPISKQRRFLYPIRSQQPMPSKCPW